jgi:hypothetical protein
MTVAAKPDVASLANHLDAFPLHNATGIIYSSAQSVSDKLDSVANSVITDHGALTGLADDDHTQYAMKATFRSSEVTAVKTSVYSIAASDKIIRVDSTGGAFYLTLPDPALKWFGYIQDVGGMLSTYQVTLLQYSAEMINAIAASRALYGDYNLYLVWSDGLNYWCS